MNPEEEIQLLEDTKAEIERFAEELDFRLSIGELDTVQYQQMMEEKLQGKTKEEVLIYIDSKILEEKNLLAQIEDESLIHESKRKRARESERKRIMTIGAAGLLLIVLVAISMLYNTGEDITGYATATKQFTVTTEYNRLFDAYTETQLNLERITSLKITGTLQGTRAVVKLRINGTDYLVGEITASQQGNQITGAVIGEETPPPYSLATDKSSYGLGETAMIITTPAPEAGSESIYIYQGEESQKLEAEAFTPQVAGEYQVVALIVMPDDILRLETNFTVTEAAVVEEPVIENNATPNATNETVVEPPVEVTEFAFTNLCTGTCKLPENTDPTLIVELEPGTTLTIDSISTIQNRDNEAPAQTSNIPDITLPIGQATELDLNSYFMDPDGDVVQYDINEIPEIISAITQNLLTLSGTTPGIYTAYIYATDGDKLVTSNTFLITITETGQPINNTNQTNQTQQPIGAPITTTDCSDPNPNNRPASCIEGNEEDYFKKQSIRLQNLDRNPIARFTSYGNLVIRGSLIESSQGTPGPRDFRVGYTMPESEIEVITSWIDSETGDLHLKGRLYEEQLELQPGGNVYLIQNRKNTNLGYFDRDTGDLYLRGNLITGRSSEDITAE